MQGRAGISLLFAVGTRPTASAIEALMDASESAGRAGRVSHRADDGDGWLEILASGLTFDLRGLAPAAAAALPPANHGFGLDLGDARHDLEAVVLTPGPHIAGGAALMPVVRTLMRLATSGIEVIAIAGNHDHAATFEAYRPLMGHAGIRLFGHARPATRGGAYRFRARSTGEEAVIAVLPFLSQRYAVRAAQVIANTPAENP